MGPAEVDRRQSARATVMLAATISNSTLSEAVKLRNLSPSGALVEGGVLPREGSRILFGRNGQWLRSQMVWVDGQQGGVRFEEPVDLSASLRQVATPKPVAPPRGRRPGLKCAPLTEGDRRNWERWAAVGLTAFGD